MSHASDSVHDTPMGEEEEDDEEAQSSASETPATARARVGKSHMEKVDDADTSKLMGPREHVDGSSASVASASPARSAHKIPHVAPRHRSNKRPRAGAYGVTVAPDGSYFKPEKAYKNVDFLNSREAKPIRIMCEYVETERR